MYKKILALILELAAKEELEINLPNVQAETIAEAVSEMVEYEVQKRLFVSKIKLWKYFKTKNQAGRRWPGKEKE